VPPGKRLVVECEIQDSQENQEEFIGHSRNKTSINLHQRRSLPSLSLPPSLSLSLSLSIERERSELVPDTLFLVMQEVKDNSEFVRLANDNNAYAKGRKGASREQNLFSDTISETAQATKGHYSFTGPAQVTASSGFAWAKTRKEDSTSTVSYDPSVSSSQISAEDSSRFNFANSSFDFTKAENGRNNFLEASAKHVMQKQHNQSDPFDSLNVSEAYYFNDLNRTEDAVVVRSNLIM
jgi:hypothetical protein